jgi:uncharacterized protein (TIGR02466 family)
MNEFIKPIFSTPLLIAECDNQEILTQANTLAYTLRDNLNTGSLVSEEWDMGIKSSNKEDFYTSGVTSFNSTEDLFNKSEWSDVCNFIYNFTGILLNSVNSKKIPYHIINMWTTIYPQNCFVPEHIHSNSYLSGVFYTKAEKNCGNLVFHDPSWTTKTMFMNSNIPEFPNVETKHPITPKPGLLVLFPSWLPHRSLPNKSGSDRIIISFNIGF